MIYYLVLLVVNMVAFFLGYLFTLKWRISRLKALDMKPFNCRPCLTFWLTVMCQIGYYIVVPNILTIVLGTLSALAFFIIIRYDERNKIKIEE